MIKKIMLINDKEKIILLNGKEFHCAMDITMNYIGGKWKTVVLWYLRKDKKRFGELKKLIPNITEKMLSLQLKDLESDGIVRRKIYPEVPPKVEYYLTEFGKTLIPMLEEIAKWGRGLAESKGKIVDKRR
ncbi:MAG TPA: winged helix-turn-helix transcriptional regulator [Cyclobacteriaceae bacterium]|nr:winged helix-turn-helix transcriptional regulator [Cyclobacteriaceae bacterium]